MNNQPTITTTPTEMNRLVREFTTTYPCDVDPFVGLPETRLPDLELYRAAGAHLDDPPLPPGLTRKELRSLAEWVLKNAELELKAALVARMDFDQNIMVPFRVRFQCGFPLSFIMGSYQQTAGAASQAWIPNFREPVLFWAKDHERVSRRQRGLATVTLCRLRQMSCGYGLLARAILEPLWGDPEGRFTTFHDQIIAEMPKRDFHYTGQRPGANSATGSPPAAPLINNTPMSQPPAEHGPTSGATQAFHPRPRQSRPFAPLNCRAVLRSVSAAPFWPNATRDPAYDPALLLLGSAQLELGACLAVRAVVTAGSRVVEFVHFLRHLPRHELLDYWQSVCSARPTMSADLRAWSVARVAEARLIQTEYQGLLDRHEDQPGSVSPEEFAELTDRLGGLSHRLLKPHLKSAPGVDALFNQVAVPGCRFHYTK